MLGSGSVSFEGKNCDFRDGVHIFRLQNCLQKFLKGKKGLSRDQNDAESVGLQDLMSPVFGEYFARDQFEYLKDKKMLLIFDDWDLVPGSIRFPDKFLKKVSRMEGIRVIIASSEELSFGEKPKSKDLDVYHYHLAGLTNHESILLMLIHFKDLFVKFNLDSYDYKLYLNANKLGSLKNSGRNAGSLIENRNYFIRSDLGIHGYKEKSHGQDASLPKSAYSQASGKSGCDSLLRGSEIRSSLGNKNGLTRSFDGKDSVGCPRKEVLLGPHGILGEGTPNLNCDLTREFSADRLVGDGRLKTAEFIYETKLYPSKSVNYALIMDDVSSNENNTSLSKNG